jgi:hypothetical protein
LLLKLKAFMHFCFSWTRTISRRGRLVHEHFRSISIHESGQF